MPSEIFQLVSVIDSNLLAYIYILGLPALPALPKKAFLARAYDLLT